MVKRNVVLSFVVLATLLASITLAFGLLYRDMHPSFAQSPPLTITDYALSSGQDPWGTAFDSSGNVWVAIPGCDPSPTCSSSTPPGKIAEFNPSSSNWIAIYQLPAGFGQPLFVQFDAAGNLWFTMPMSNSIGTFNLHANTFQQFPVPTPGAGPWDLAIDNNSNIWFTEHYTDKIGEFNPSTQTMKEFVTPTVNSLPYGIVVDSSNNIWFTENNPAVAQIGEYTSKGLMEEYQIRSAPPSGLTPHLIAVDPHGNLWWSEGWVGMIGELVVSKAIPGTNAGVTEYAYPTSCASCGTHTSGIKVDGNNQVWFDDSLQGIFGSFPDSGKGAFSIYAAPTPQHPHDGLNVDVQGRVWFTEEFANKLAEAVPAGSQSPTPSPSPAVTLAQDTFQRGNQTHWGAASDGSTWAGDANSSNVFSIVNNAGTLSGGGTSYSAVLGTVANDAEVLFSGSISNFNYTNIGAVLRWTDTNDWYKAYIDGANLVLQKKVNGTASVLKSISFAAQAGVSYTLRFNITGTTLSAKVWQTGTAEPAAWMATAIDSAFASGYCGLRILDQSGAVVTITSFLATAQ